MASHFILSWFLLELLPLTLEELINPQPHLAECGAVRGTACRGKGRACTHTHTRTRERFHTLAGNQSSGFSVGAKDEEASIKKWSG